MTSLLGNVASILGMFGVIAFFVLLSLLIFRLIMYKENANKRAEFMDGIVNLIAGLIIIGLMTVIVEMIYYYIQQIDPNIGSLIAQADTKSIKDGIAQGTNGDGSLLAGMISDLISFLLQGLTSLFGLQTIQQLIMPQNAQIFTNTGWSMIMGAYVILIVPAVILMLFMVFRTGLQFMMGGTNPKDMVKARASILRWVIVLFVIVFGEIIIRGICMIGSDFTMFFNSQLQLLMPDLSSQGSIFFGMKLGGSGLIGGIISLYMVYLQFRFNILFIVRDIMIVAFTIFTPIAVTLWGIEPSTVSLKVWFGEIVSNALMAFCLSIGFLAFAITYDIFALNKAGNGELMLVTLVGLTMILKVGSTLRNSTQGMMFQFASLNEDKIGKSMAGGAFATGVVGGVLGKAARNTGASYIAKGANMGAAAIKDKIATSGYGESSSKNESKKMNNVGEQADSSANAILQDAVDNGIELNPNNLTSTGKSGNVNKLSNEAIGLNFADKIQSNMKNEEFGNRKDAVESAKDSTISDIARQYANNPELRASMPPSITKQDDINSWANKKAENKFAEAIGSRDLNPVNHPTEIDGYEHFSSATGENKIQQAAIEEDQQKHISQNNISRSNMNNAVDDIGSGRFKSFDHNMADTIADTARTDRYKDKVETDSNFNTSSPIIEPSGGAEKGGSTSSTNNNIKDTNSSSKKDIDMTKANQENKPTIDSF